MEDSDRWFRTVALLAIMVVTVAIVFVAVALNSLADAVQVSNQVDRPTEVSGRSDLGFQHVHSHPGCVEYRTFAVDEAGLKAAADGKFDVFLGSVAANRMLMCKSEGSH